MDILLGPEIDKLTSKTETSPFFDSYNPLKPCPAYTITYGGLRYRHVTIDTEDLLDQLISMFERLDRKFIAFDTETNDLYGEIVGLSFSMDGERGYYIPVGHDFGVQLDRDYVMERLRPYFEADDYIWVCWNFAYEYVVLKKHHGIHLKKYHDGMLIAFLLNENLPAGLKPRSTIELGLTATQDFNKIVPKNTTANQHSILKVGVYASQDAVITLKTYKELLKHPEFPYILKSYLDCELPAAKWFAEMTLNGFKIVPSILREIKEKGQQQLKDIETEIYYEASFNPETGEYEAFQDDNGEWHNLLEFNISSPQQVGRVFFDRLKLPVYKRTATGNPSLDSKKALPLYIRDGVKIAELLQQRNKLAKVISNYTDKLIAAKDDKDRIYPSYNQIGAKTGRASASNPPFQQMPSKDVIKGAPSIRSAFVAREGYELIVCDFSQLEMRVLAHFSEDEAMLSVFNDGIDMHSKNAAAIEGIFYGKPISYEDFIAKLEEEKVAMANGVNKVDCYYTMARDTAKTVGFKINYGGGADDIRGITWDFVDAYYKAIPEVAIYKEIHKLFVLEHGYTVKLLGGRRRSQKVYSDKFYEVEEAHRETFSAHIQGSAADLMKLSMIDVGEYIEANNIPCFMIAQVHDELVLECRVDWVEHMMEKTQFFMENCYKLRVPLEAEPGRGHSWMEAK